MDGCAAGWVTAVVVFVLGFATPFGGWCSDKLWSLFKRS